ncbi:Maintenance of telomere capping protein 6 [Yarrowia sp. B02]|nr:Maintenance of telomere capping protein 6 [Yarrowia sp. B02]
MVWIWTLLWTAILALLVPLASAKVPDVHRSIQPLKKRDDDALHDANCQEWIAPVWPGMSHLMVAATRAERDVSYNVSIDQLTYKGAELTPLVFKKYGYTQEGIFKAMDLLKSGMTSLGLDVYWNNREQYWQLCPVVFPANSVPGTPVLLQRRLTTDIVTCDQNATLTYFLAALSQHVNVTDNNLVVDLISLKLNLRTVEISPTSSNSSTLRKRQFRESTTVTQLDSSILSSLFDTSRTSVSESVSGSASGSSSGSASGSVTSGVLSDSSSSSNASRMTNSTESTRTTSSTESASSSSATPSTYTTGPQMLGNIVGSSYIGPRLYTPKDLARDRDAEPPRTYDYQGLSSKGFPLAHYILLEMKARVMVSLSQNDQPNGYGWGAADQDVIFTKQALMGSSDPEDTNENIAYENLQECIRLDPTFLQSINLTGAASWRTYASSQRDPISNVSFQEFINCGLSPSINNTLAPGESLQKLMTESLWSWAEDEPSKCHNESVTRTQDRNTGLVAWNCAVLMPDGWHVANCYDTHYPLCRQGELAYNWAVGTQKINYFDTAQEKNICPPGYSFSLPRTALQNIAAKITVRGVSGKTKVYKGGDSTDPDNYDTIDYGSSAFPVWIDLNSISQEDCWVSGGPTARCPYRTVQSHSVSVALLTVASAVCAGVAAAIILLQMDTQPIKKNSGRWRRLMSNFKKSEYESVPA